MKRFIVFLATALTAFSLFSLNVYAGVMDAAWEEAESSAEWLSLQDVWTLAGTGSHGAADGALVQFNLPYGVAVMADGRLLVADSFNNLIRSIRTDGYGTLFAGRLRDIGADNFPLGGYRDDTVFYSLFFRPIGLAINDRGWVFVADMYNHAVRVIIDGEVYTFAGGLGAGYANGLNARFNRPTAITVDDGGYVFVADTGNHVIRRISPEGYVITVAGVAGVHGFADGSAGTALFDSPMGVAVTDGGVLLVADTGNHLIRKIEDGVVSTFAGYGNFTAARDGGEGFWLGGFADGLARSSLFNHPMGLALWGDVVLVADSLNHSIRAVSLSGEVWTVAGTGYSDHVDGSLNEAAFHFPSGLGISGNTLFVADTGNNMIRVINLSALSE